MSAASRQPVHVIPNDLARWDQAKPGDLMLVPIWTDVRPLRGASGLLDWRMCGRLSSFMLAGKVTGVEGEQTLFPSGGRLAWRLVLAVGGGARAEFSEKRLRALMQRTLGTLQGLGVSRIALALPGRDGDPASAFAATAGSLAASTPAASATASAGVGVPPAAPQGISARTALDFVLAEIDAHPGIVADLTVLVPAAAQKEVAETLRLRAVRS